MGSAGAGPLLRGVSTPTCPPTAQSRHLSSPRRCARERSFGTASRSSLTGLAVPLLLAARNVPGDEPERDALGRLRGGDQVVLVAAGHLDRLRGQVLLRLVQVAHLERGGVVDL